jgi:acetyltransferase-like isoleucine patch superfamily enzyme
MAAGELNLSPKSDAATAAAQRGRLRYYLEGQSTGVGRYVLEQTLFSLLRGIPGLIGIGMRALAYRLILNSDGWPIVEDQVRLRQPATVHLGRHVYIDYGVYLHGGREGIFIGDDTFIMHSSELHVYNFRDLPHAGIWVGKGCFIGEFSLIRGQGGVHIGDDVLLAPNVQVLAVNHAFDDPDEPIIKQGITTQGISIDDGAWVGAGAIVLDGVRIGDRSVVGAGAVVTEDVPPRSLAVGAPARVIRHLDTDHGIASARANAMSRSHSNVAAGQRRGA